LIFPLIFYRIFELQIRLSEDKYRGVGSDKLKIDDKKQYIISLPGGEEIKVDLNDREIYTVENWFLLIGKHNLRFDIWNILQIYNEANVTQISNMVEQSKSTVARHLKLMEKDGLILSRKAEKTQQGKIPPKLFRVNRKLFRIVENNPVNKSPPDDPSELIEFYKKVIQTFRSSLYIYKLLLDSLNPLLDDFEDHLDDIDAAKDIYEKHFNFGRLDPQFAYSYFSDKYYEQLMDLFTKHIQKRSQLLSVQNNDPEIKERDYTYIAAILPVKALVEIYRRRMKEE